MAYIIDKILEGKPFFISENRFIDVLEKASEVLEAENLVEKSWDEFLVVGDTHGDLSATVQAVQYGMDNHIPAIFLGDYVDRGDEQLENLIFLLSLKIEHPSSIILLRGNHETLKMNQYYGFRDELLEHFPENFFDVIIGLYELLPVAAVINDGYFMVHGGIPSSIENIDEIKDLSLSDGAYDELLWNDPTEEEDGFAYNNLRGIGHLFGKTVFDDFLEKNDMEMVFRAHQAFEDGYRYFFDDKLLSLFSVPDYRDENDAKFCKVSEDGVELIDISKE
ncbi:MAG: metallophosphoesterase [Thermoplasmata archaeon]